MTTFAATDTQRRFIGAIAERVQLERVQELYLFAPLRQGGVETGVAVVAVTQANSASEPAGASAADDAEEPFDLDTAGSSRDSTATKVEVAASAVEPESEAAPLLPDVDPRCDPTDAAAQGDDVAEPQPARCTVITARYRLQLKGPERGRWEMDIVEEADAPLVTVDVVVRGVQRRVGDAAEVERLDGAEVAVFLSDPTWPRTK